MTASTGGSPGSHRIELSVGMLCSLLLWRNFIEACVISTSLELRMQSFMLDLQFLVIFLLNYHSTVKSGRTNLSFLLIAYRSIPIPKNIRIISRNSGYPMREENENIVMLEEENPNKTVKTFVRY